MSGGYLAWLRSGLGQVLAAAGFVEDGVDEGTENFVAVVWFRTPGCQLEIYRDPARGELNCRLAPPGAERGLQSPGAPGPWRYLAELTGRDESTHLATLLQRVPATPRPFADQLARLRRELAADLAAATAALAAH